MLVPHFTNRLRKATMGKEITKAKIAPNLGLKEPSMYKVIYMNDDVTTVDFVVMTLIDFFDHTAETAAEMTEKIHNEGSAVVAILPYEIAEQKGVEVTHVARTKGYPLVVKLESE